MKLNQWHGLLAGLTLVSAQTYSECNPMKNCRIPYDMLRKHANKMQHHVLPTLASLPQPIPSTLPTEKTKTTGNQLVQETSIIPLLAQNSQSMKKEMLLPFRLTGISCLVVWKFTSRPPLGQELFHLPSCFQMFWTRCRFT